MSERARRPRVRALDALLGVSFPVLNDGFVRAIDYMGGDASVAQAARVSYGTGTRRVHEDRGLIRYLMRHGHTTPFEMCEVKLHVRVPMDTWRQWIRHRTASVNEYSTRYSIAIDAAQRTAPDEWRLQSSANRQGSKGVLSSSIGKRLTIGEERIQRQSRKVYGQRLKNGVAREQARKDLPLSTYTEAYWKIDLHNLLHFLRLRMDAQAQEEIRAYATAIGERIVAVWVPTVWEAFLDYRMNALQLSQTEVELMCAVTAGDLDSARKVARERGILKRGRDGRLKPSRERSEFEEKARRLGLPIPWESR